MFKNDLYFHLALGAWAGFMLASLFLGHGADSHHGEQMHMDTVETSEIRASQNDEHPHSENQAGHMTGQ